MFIRVCRSRINKIKITMLKYITGITPPLTNITFALVGLNMALIIIVSKKFIKYHIVEKQKQKIETINIWLSKINCLWNKKIEINQNGISPAIDNIIEVVGRSSSLSPFMSNVI